MRKRGYAFDWQWLTDYECPPLAPQCRRKFDRVPFIDRFLVGGSRWTADIKRLTGLAKHLFLGDAADRGVPDLTLPFHAPAPGIQRVHFCELVCHNGVCLPHVRFVAGSGRHFWTAGKESVYMSISLQLDEEQSRRLEERAARARR